MNIKLCGTITNVGKFVVICALILLGLFAVFMINTNTTKVKPATENPTLNLSSVSPTPTPAIINSMSNQTPSPTSKTNDVSNGVTAVIKTERGDIEIAFYSKDAPNTVQNFVQKAKRGFYNNLKI